MASVSNLFAAAEHWESPVLDYVGFQGVAPWDGAAGNTRHVNRAILCGASLRSPVVGAFMLPGDASIYIGHSPSEYAPDALQASPFDNALVVLVGNDLTSVTPLVLHESSTHCCTANRTFSLARTSPCRPSGQLVTPKPSGSGIIRRTASVTKTPVRTPTKRVAVHSPSISPQKDSPIAKAKGIQSIDNIDSLKPAVLDQQLSRQIKYKKLSAEEVKQKVSGEEWRHEWDHPQILDELLSEPIPPNPAEVLGYDFDLEDPTTCTLLRTINGIRVGEHMRKHVLTVKKPEASRMHPKFGPFTLVTMDSDNGKLAVFNRKHDRAFTFKREDFPLDIRDLDFDTMDATTFNDE